MEQDLRREAVERAYRDHADDVYRIAYAILGDAEAAADATQDAFVRAFGHWQQWGGAGGEGSAISSISPHAAARTRRP